MIRLYDNCTRLGLLVALVFTLALAGCGDGEPAGQNQGESPCPCSGNAICSTQDGQDVCVASVGGDCATDGYVCDANMVCEEGSCMGEQGYGCADANECRGSLNCIDGECDSPCPCDESAGCEESELGVDICQSPLYGPCGADGYRCDEDEGLVCDEDTCLGDEEFPCTEDDDCSEGLECVDGECTDYDGPCPCDGNAACEEGDEEDAEVCVVPVGGDCGADDYVCEEGLECDDGECVVAEEWLPCDNDDECGGDFECIGGFCTEDTCNMPTDCPDDGDSETVDQNFCNEAGDGCVQCRHWAGESAGYGAADCDGAQVCTADGYCADPIYVPRTDPFTDDGSLQPAEAIAIASAICWLVNDGGSWSGSKNAMCGTLVVDEDIQDISQSDVRDPATGGDFDYLEDEGDIDGYSGADVADEIESVWVDRTPSANNRWSWFSEGDIDEVPAGSRGEIVMWLGKAGTGYPTRVGVDTLEGYWERGYIDNWNEDGD